jgi:hypothetical protein
VTLRRTSRLPRTEPHLARMYGVLAESALVETNDQRILDAADASFGRFGAPRTESQPITLRVLCEPDRPDGPESSEARLAHHIDGHMYLVSAPGDVAVVDAEAGHGVAFLHAGTPDDERFVRYSFIEGMALAMVSRGRGYIPLHASGVAREGIGVALVGPEGAGKSTLAVAAARRGLGVFAEDSVFVRAGRQGLEFWGLPWSQRLVLEACQFFPEFADVPPTRQPNGELKVEVDLDEHYPGLAKPWATPGAVVVLHRDPGGAADLVRLDGNQAPLDFNWPWGDAWTDGHEHAARLLRELPVYRLTLGATPDDTIALLESLLEGLASSPTAR